MKLHLPKVLSAAVMLAFAPVAFTTAQAVEQVVNVGLVNTTAKKAEHTTISATTNDVTVGSGQAIGAFTDEGALITSFGTYTYDNKAGTIDNSDAIVTNHLKVNKQLTIEGDGQVYLGGQIKITEISKRDSYSGLIAESVVVNGDGSKVNLQAGSATLGTLTLNSGNVRLHADGTPSGNSLFWGVPDVGTDCKIVKINTALNVHGGSLQMGYQSKASSGTSHYQTYFSDGAEINQTGGSIAIAGQARLSSGTSITQSGGTFTTPTTYYGHLAFELGSDSYSINQVNPASGETAATGPSMKIDRLATASTTKLDITQTADKGTIDLTAGSNVADSKFKTKEAGTLKQNSKEGTVTLRGDFSGTVFNIEQSGTGTINFASDASIVSNSLKLSTTANLNIEGSLVLNSGGTFEISAATADNAAISLGSDGSLRLLTDSIQALSLSLSDFIESEMQSQLAAADTETFRYTIDLIFAQDETQLTDFSQLLSWEYQPMVTAQALSLQDTITTYDDSGLIVSETADGNYMLQAYVDWKVESTASVPEPTTATLSLLALAGLAARRRRK